jgi:hypothetical protein
MQHPKIEMKPILVILGEGVDAYNGVEVGIPTGFPGPFISVEVASKGPLWFM